MDELIMEAKDFLPEEINEPRKSIPLLLTDKEKKLIKMYAKEKGWSSLTGTMRICTKAVILMEYQMAGSLEEALKKSTLLEIDGRKKR
jgi:hypothetical protein